MDAMNTKNPKTITILHIRQRDETSRQSSEQLAEETERPVRSVPFLYDLPKHSDILETLRQETTPTIVITPISVRATAALLQFLKVTTPILNYFVLDTSESDAVSTVAIAVKTWLEQHSISEKDTNSDNEHRVTAATDTVEYLCCEVGSRRWYPLIDTTACTGCLECVNFCLFGVYSLTADSQPQVENPDSCRDGCPACARVCPGGAILFPLYSDNVISGKVAAPTNGSRDEHAAARLRDIHTTTAPNNVVPAEVTSGVINEELDRLIDQTEWM